MASNKGTKRTAEVAELARIADIDVADALYATSHNARKVQITNNSNSTRTEYHNHHHHSFTTVVTPVPTIGQGYHDMRPWQRSERTLKELESLLVKATANSEASFNDVVSKKNSLDKEREASEAALLKQRAVVDQRAAVVSKTNVDLVAAQRKIAERGTAEEDQVASESALVKLDIVKGDAMVFQSGKIEKPDDPKLVAAVMPLVQRLGLEDALVSAFPEAAAKKASLRSVEERSVVDSIEKAVKARLLAVRNNLASHTLQEFQAELRAAEDHHRAASAALKIAEAECCRKATEFHKAQGASDAVQPEVERARVDWEKAAAFLKQFREGPLAAFRGMDEQLADQLLERALPKKESLESPSAGRALAINAKEKTAQTTPQRGKASDWL